jgi:hypothetical protein
MDYIQKSDQKLSERDKKAKESASQSTLNRESGIGNSARRESFPRRKKTVAETTVAEGLYNSYIVLGKDRVDDETSGKGGKGYDRAGMIHLVAGAFGANLEDYIDSPENADGLNPSFMIDSAYIYISQKADIDEYLNIANGSIGQSKEKSAIAIKADDLRLVGERGIKLVTGRYQQDSFRRNSTVAKGIDLIAGNDSKDLQPLLKGIDTIEAVTKLSSLLQQSLEIVSQALVYQAKVNSEVASHEHITSVPKEPTLPLKASLKVTCNGANQNLNEHVFREIKNILTDIGLFRQKYLQQGGEKYIASKFNNTN